MRVSSNQERVNLFEWQNLALTMEAPVFTLWLQSLASTLNDTPLKDLLLWAVRPGILLWEWIFTAQITRIIKQPLVRSFLFLCDYGCIGDALRWRHNGRDSVSNHQPQDCLFNRLFRRRSKKTSKLRVTDLCAGNSPHKWPVTRKMLPFDDVIMGKQAQVLYYYYCCCCYFCCCYWKWTYLILKYMA